MPPRVFFLACLAMPGLAFVPGPAIPGFGWRLLAIPAIGAGVAMAAPGKRRSERTGTAIRR